MLKLHSREFYVMQEICKSQTKYVQISREVNPTSRIHNPKAIYASNVYNTVTFLLHVRGIEIVAEATHAASQSDTAADLASRFEFLLHLR